MSEEKIHALDVARVEHDYRLKRVEELITKTITVEQFSIVKLLVYGLATIILMAFGTALVKVVIK
ncbi:hypothetical protein [Pseudomonas sp. PS01301]|uniref:hypothetical protein n=1 Tax=Pseudomonas sp. PS01301 TaxID=2991437 RepID=UPI00249A55A7|nr:hypothetical protein [Pseudomonas sp. PS01301]